MGTKISRLEEIRKELGLTKAQFAAEMGIIPNYYTHISLENGKSNLRLEHLENLLASKGVNPTWIITGEGDKYITKSVSESGEYPVQEKPPTLIVVSKKDLIKGVMKVTGLVMFPGDLAYDILDNLVTKTLSNNPDFPRDYERAIHVLADFWLSMLELVQNILDQDIEFEYGGKKYTFRREGD